MQQGQDAQQFIVADDGNGHGGADGIRLIGKVDPAVVFFGVAD
jgi:hypothetical protein